MMRVLPPLGCGLWRSQLWVCGLIRVEALRNLWRGVGCLHVAQ